MPRRLDENSVAMNMSMVTVLGFYFRIYLLGLRIEKANEEQGNNGSS